MNFYPYDYPDISNPLNVKIINSGLLPQLPYSFHLFSYICKLFHHTNVKTNGPDLTKILENLSSRCRAQSYCSQRTTNHLNIGDKILKFIPLKSIPVIFPDWKAEDSNEKQKVMIAPCILLPEFENGWTSQSERPEYPS